MVKQTVWFLACWFYDIWTCEKFWVNVWIDAVFHRFLFYLTLISFVGMDFQIFSSFLQVVGLSAFGDDRFLKNTEKCDFMWLIMEKL